MNNAIKFCAQCGGRLTTEYVAGRERPVCRACGHIVYRNPVPVAIVIATLKEKLLLVRRANNPLQGYWAPPAGYIEIDETLEAGAAREVREETGYEVAIDRLLGLYSRPNTGVIFVAYQGHIIGGHAHRDEEETLDMGLFALDELPQQGRSGHGSEMDIWFFEVVSALLTDFLKEE